MNIGQAAEAAGVNAKLIRHYESIGIIAKPVRSSGGYRQYSKSTVHTLAFIGRARSLGFSMPEIKKLLSLWRNKSRKSADVKAIVEAHIKKLDSKINEIKEMKNTLMHLSSSCHGDERPNCPILENLEKKHMNVD